MKPAHIGLLVLFVLFPGASLPAEVPPVPAPAALGGIAGRILDPLGNAAAGSRVLLVEARREARADNDGRFLLEAVSPGRYHLAVSTPRFRDAVLELTVRAGAIAEVEVRLDAAIHLEEIVVTASPDARGLAETYQPTTALGRDELDARAASSLGETLAQEPGVSSTFFGPGASRPIIRGLGGDRVRILQGGLGTGDLSSISADHAVSLDVASADRIETVRGPATLLYGGSAIGGVVNVIDNRIPDHRPEKALAGSAEIGGASSAGELTGSAEVDGGAGALAWHVDALRRRTEDYRAPSSASGPTASGSLREVENSDLDARGLTGGLSLVGGVGNLGVSYGAFDTTYGKPMGPSDDESTPETPVRIDLEQRRLDLRGELVRDFAILRGLRGRVGHSDYTHAELEGAEVGTVFSNDAWEARIEAPQRPWGALTGTIGVQLGRRDFAAAGAEQLVPPTRTGNVAVFAYEEVGPEALKLQLGGRFEHQSVDPDGDDLARRTFDGFSGSAGLVWLYRDGYSIAGSVARAFKPPAAEELFSNGPHDATGSFEIGDPTLAAESSLGLDLSLRKRTGWLTGEFNLFRNGFRDFIYQRFTGEVDAAEGFPIIAFSQADATFWGMEGHADVALLRREPHHLDLEVTTDYVRATLTASDEPLPLIPPFRVGAGLRYQGSRLSSGVAVRHVAAQDRVAAFETETDGYTMLEARVGVRLFAGATVHDFLLRGTNLNNALGRNHASLLKAVAPLPGRDFRLSYRIRF